MSTGCESYLVAVKPLLDKVPIKQYCKKPQELVDRLFNDYIASLSWTARSAAKLGLLALGSKKEKWFKTARVLFWKLNQDPEFIDSCQQNNVKLVKEKVLAKLLQLQDYITACTGSKNKTRKLNAANSNNFNAGRNAVVANLPVKKISMPANRSIHNNADAIMTPSVSHNNLTVVGSVGSDPRAVSNSNTASTVSLNSVYTKVTNNLVANNHAANNRVANNRVANNRVANNRVANNRVANNVLRRNNVSRRKNGNNNAAVATEENNNNFNYDNFQTARSSANNNRGLNSEELPQFNNNNSNLIKNFKQSKWVE